MRKELNQFSELDERALRSYHEDGFLLIPEYFSAEKVMKLRSCLPQLVAAKTERKILEADGRTVRSLYGIHKDGELLPRIGRHPLLVRAAQQLLGGDVYIYQSKSNWKAPFAGEKWDWHQDFTYWHNEDSMPEPRATNIAVLLHELNEFNGALYLVPGSHRHGIHKYCALSDKPKGYEQGPAWISNLTAQINYAIDKDELTRLISERGIVCPKAKAGSLLIFDSNIVHASPPNITPFERTMLIYTYNHVDNAPPESKRRRPEFLASSDTRPLQPLTDDPVTISDAA